MKRLMAACAALTLTGCVAPGMPGMDPMAGMAGGDQAQRQADSMMAAQASAQAAAVHPGDEALSCEALQAEMQAVMNEPAVKTAIAENGATAQAQMDKAKAAQAGAVAGAVGTTALGVASSFVPGLSWFSQGAMMAQQAGMAAQMKESNRTMTQMSANMTSIMPQMMRGQRIYELASAKKCAFLNQPKPA
jgi:hypothetical protein